MLKNVVYWNIYSIRGQRTHISTPLVPHALLRNRRAIHACLYEASQITTSTSESPLWWIFWITQSTSSNPRCPRFPSPCLPPSAPALPWPPVRKRGGIRGGATQWVAHGFPMSVACGLFTRPSPKAGQGLKMQTVFYSFSIFEGGGGGEVDRDNENDAIECSKLQVEQRTIAILSIKDSERGFSWW